MTKRTPSPVWPIERQGSGFTAAGPSADRVLSRHRSADAAERAFVRAPGPCQRAVRAIEKLTGAPRGGWIGAWSYRTGYSKGRWWRERAQKALDMLTPEHEDAGREAVAELRRAIATRLEIVRRGGVRRGAVRVVVGPEWADADLLADGPGTMLACVGRKSAGKARAWWRVVGTVSNRADHPDHEALYIASKDPDAARYGKAAILAHVATLI